MDESEVFDNAFELGGYYAVQAFATVLAGNPSQQLGFYGGDSLLLTQIDFTGTEDQVLKTLFRNEAGCSFATRITDVAAPEDFQYATMLQVEMFDFEVGTSGTVAVPYSKKERLSSSRIYDPVVFGIQTSGVLDVDPLLDFIVRLSFLQGVVKNPEHSQAWAGKYVGDMLNAEINHRQL